MSALKSLGPRPPGAFPPSRRIQLFAESPKREACRGDVERMTWKIFVQ